MSLRAEFSLVNSEFNDFLFAYVGEEHSGTQLTVLSALSRLGFDPWGEAARLANLPREASTQALAAAIAMLPVGDWKVSDASAIAARLVGRLPNRSAAPAAVPSRLGGDAGGRKTKQGLWVWVFCIALASASVFVTLQYYNGRDAAPDPNAVWSRQQ